MDELDPRLLSNRLSEIEAVLDSLAPAVRERLLGPLLALASAPARPLLERISAGNALGLLGDPRVDTLAPRMCRIPAGRFSMGTDEAEVPSLARRWGIPEAWFAKSTPRHVVELDAFEIAVHPVTEAEWARFVAETDLDERPSHWTDPAPPRGRANHPVHGVSWQGVLLYTEWLSERTGTAFRVPTEAEWERAARGTDGRAHPWGDDFSAARCNTREGGVGGTTPIGVYPDGASPCGALDLAGNVEELVADLYRRYPGSKFDDPDYGSYRMTRGGVWSLDGDLARCDRRHGSAFAGPTGFRLARSAAHGWLDR
ncbi:MAG: SUMF1/EgtB/PvdO family nonheme iron enzyme [Myxococcota bacterium]